MINYQKELDKLIQNLEKEGKVPRLLIHSCCAPCSSYCLEYLSEYFDTSKEFKNPYDEDPADIHAICFSANGDILGKNIYEQDIIEILSSSANNASNTFF